MPIVFCCYHIEKSGGTIVNNIKSYSYKAKDKVNPLKWLTVAGTIALMGGFVYAVHESIVHDANEIDQSIDELEQSLEDYKKKYGL